MKKGDSTRERGR